jgi:ribonuclease T1
MDHDPTEHHRRHVGRPRVLLGVALAILLSLFLATGTSTASAGTIAPAALPDCALSTLPQQAEDTIELIYDGGPFPYRQDGTVFQNRERLLPIEDSGYYREYTVPTPGSDTRGARRIVGGGFEPTEPNDLYYTGDHYASFCHIV